MVRFNPRVPQLFVTASSDTTVALWDERNLAFPYHVLEGHTGAVFAGEWAPMRGSVLATAGLDRRVIVWDLEKVGAGRGVDGRSARSRRRRRRRTGRRSCCSFTGDTRRR